MLLHNRKKPSGFIISFPFGYYDMSYKGNLAYHGFLPTHAASKDAHIIHTKLGMKGDWFSSTHLLV